MEKINLVAFCLPVVIFLFWQILGYSFLSILRTQRNTMQNLLLAPTIGMAGTLLPVFFLNRMGIPIGHFAVTLSLSLLAMSAAIFYWRKPLFPFRRYLPFALILLLSLLITGRPLLLFGFDWISYGNDDMENYCLAALRFLQHGYSEFPSATDLSLNKDYSLSYWFMHVVGLSRSGSELLLAWVSGITSLNPLAIFMPTIVAFNLTLISVTSALVYQSKRWRNAALAVAVLLTFSALNSLGTLYQLIAQVGGLSLLTASVLLLLHPYSIRAPFISLRSGMLIAVVLSAMLILYPEVLPFLALSYFLYFLLGLIQGWKPTKTFYVCTFFSALIVILLLNKYLPTALYFLFMQAKGGLSNDINIKAGFIFPYYLIPSGFANLWGLQAIGNYIIEPGMSITIAMGFILFCISVAVILWAVWKRIPSAIVSLVMLCLSIKLFTGYADFGLFKLAMYFQPFLLSTLAIAIFTLIKSKNRRLIPILVLIIFSIPAQNYYVNRSRALNGGGLTEIIYGSNTKLSREYSQLVSKLPSDSVLILDDFNLSLIKLEGLNSQGKPTYHLVYPLIDYIQNPMLPPKLFLPKEILKYHVDFHKNVKHFRFLNFSQLDANDSIKLNPFMEMRIDTSNPKRTFIIADTPRRSIINRRKFDTKGTNNFEVIPWNQARNHLIYLTSQYGPVYYHNKTLIPPAFYNLETDPYYPHTTMQAIGRRLLFRVVNPSKSVRAMVYFSTTLAGYNKTKPLPPMVAIGNKVAKFSAKGYGAARLFSQPLSPQLIEGHPYIAINLGRDGTSFISNKRALMKTYNEDIPVDVRLIVGFGRDISLVSEEEYQNLKAPNQISHFPDDLSNPDLEFSGAYEDGFISDQAFFMLSQPNKETKLLVIKGVMPNIGSNNSPSRIKRFAVSAWRKLRGDQRNTPANFTSTLVVLVDGKVLSKQQIKTGDFNLQLPVSYKKERRKVELQFSNPQILPGRDARIVGAQIKFIGFDKSQS